MGIICLITKFLYAVYYLVDSIGEGNNVIRVQSY